MASSPITAVTERWDRVCNLGHGAYGTVWKEQCVDGPNDSLGSVRAVKSTPKHHLKAWRIELDTLMKFSQHRDHFVQVFGHHEHENSLLIYMEFVPHGTLHNWISKHPLQEYEAIKVTIQLAQALQYMHGERVIHRDLKPQNVLVSRPAPDWHVKVADFGISKKIAATSGADSAADRGTWAFMAPEIMYGGSVRGKKRRYTPAVDIWALGATTHCILTKEPPFGGNHSDIADYARERITFKADSKGLRRCSHVCIQFLSDTMKVKVEDRLTIKQVLTHEWLAEDPSESDTSSVISWDDGPTSPDAWQDTYYPNPIPHDSVLGSTQNTLKQSTTNASMSADQPSTTTDLVKDENENEDAEALLSSNEDDVRPLASISNLPVTESPDATMTDDQPPVQSLSNSMPVRSIFAQEHSLSVAQDAVTEHEHSMDDNDHTSSDHQIVEHVNDSQAAVVVDDDVDVRSFKVPSLVITEDVTVEESSNSGTATTKPSEDDLADEVDPLFVRRSTPYAFTPTLGPADESAQGNIRSTLADDQGHALANDPPAFDLLQNDTINPSTPCGEDRSLGMQPPVLSLPGEDDVQSLESQSQQSPMAWLKNKVRRSRSSVDISNAKQAPKPRYMLCDECYEKMTDVHFHCSICQSGDFDLCPKCFSSGKRCPGVDHHLAKRCIRDNKVLICLDVDSPATEHSMTQQQHDHGDSEDHIKADSEAYAAVDPASTVSRTAGEAVEDGISRKHPLGSENGPAATAIEHKPTAKQSDGAIGKSSLQSSPTNMHVEHVGEFDADVVPPQLVGKFGLTIRRKPINARSRTAGAHANPLGEDAMVSDPIVQRTNSLPISAPSPSKAQTEARQNTGVQSLAPVNIAHERSGDEQRDEEPSQSQLENEDDESDAGSESSTDNNVEGAEEVQGDAIVGDEEAESDDYLQKSRRPYYERLRERLTQAQDIARNRGDNDEEDEELYRIQNEELEILIGQHKDKLRATFQTFGDAALPSAEQHSSHLHEMSELKRQLEEQVKELEEECCPDLHGPSAERFAVLHTSHGDVVLATVLLDGRERVQQNEEAFSRFLKLVDSTIYNVNQLWVTHDEWDVIQDDKSQHPQTIRLNCKTGRGEVGNPKSFPGDHLQYAVVEIIEGLDALKALRDLAPGWSWTMRGNFKLSGGVIMQTEVVESGKVPQKKSYTSIRGDPGKVRDTIVQRPVRTDPELEGDGERQELRES